MDNNPWSFSPFRLFFSFAFVFGTNSSSSRNTITPTTTTYPTSTAPIWKVPGYESIELFRTFSQPAGQISTSFAYITTVLFTPY
jgi:hypothetical protein